MAIKRIISTEFWTDRKVVNTFSPEDKLFMFHLLTNPRSTQIGIYPFIERIVAFEIGYSVEAVTTLLERFENVHKIVKYSRKTGEVAVKNYLRHSIIKGGAPVKDLLEKEAQAVKDKDLLRYVLEANVDNPNQTVLEFVTKYQEIYKNDNDNENDDSLPNRARIVDESSEPNKTKEIRHKYGEYQNVLLADTDLEKLKAEIPDWQGMIERLSGYIESKGVKYKNHLATMRNWARKDKDNGTGRTAGNHDRPGAGPDAGAGNISEYANLPAIRC